MDKKGMLLAEETLKIILAVIAIGVLVYLLTALYNPAAKSQEEQFAEASLERLILELESGNPQITLYNPEGWWIFSIEEGNEICICEDETCTGTNVCRDSEFKTEENIEINNPPIVLEINQQDKTISKN